MIKFNKFSSSSHTLNADFNLSQCEKIQYFVLNLMNNLTTQIRNVEFILHKFHPRIATLDSVIKSSSEPTSPSRIMCNMFWSDLDWETIKVQLNGSIRVLEVGCGSGRYGLMIDQLTCIESYLGVDIRPSVDWDKNRSERIRFCTDSYEDFAGFATNQNLIITQSALEHFSSDLRFFSSMGKYAKEVGFPILSIHLFPSPAGLFKFLLHGIRQYNRRAISRLITSSECQKPAAVWVLGGSRSNFAHLSQITLRSLVVRKPLLSNDVNIWRERLRRAIIKDCTSSSRLFPSFYALAISWNCDSEDLSLLIHTKSSQ